MNTCRQPSMLIGWWEFAVRSMGALTMPHANVERCDRVVEQLVRDSRAGAAVRRATVVTHRAWACSWCRIGLVALAAVVNREQPAARWRVVGWMTAVIGATALGLNRLAPIAIGPLTWMVPAAMIVAGVFVMAGAAPLSRAAAGARVRDAGRHNGVVSTGM
jgi:hypothetical protein